MRPLQKTLSGIDALKTKRVNITWQEAEKKDGAAKENLTCNPALKGAVLPLRRAGHADKR
jgi:hypothetical protein